MCEFHTASDEHASDAHASDEHARPGIEASDSQAGLSGTMFDGLLHQPLPHDQILLLAGLLSVNNRETRGYQRTVVGHFL